jgi:urate oxidase
VRATLIKTFFGPHETGVYSPSVQNTLFLMGEDVLQRSEKLKLPFHLLFFFFSFLVFSSLIWLTLFAPS